MDTEGGPSGGHRRRERVKRAEPEPESAFHEVPEAGPVHTTAGEALTEWKLRLPCPLRLLYCVRHTPALHGPLRWRAARGLLQAPLPAAPTGRGPVSLQPSRGCLPPRASRTFTARGAQWLSNFFPAITLRPKEIPDSFLD